MTRLCPTGTTGGGKGESVERRGWRPRDWGSTYVVPRDNTGVRKVVFSLIAGSIFHHWPTAILNQALLLVIS